MNDHQKQVAETCCTFKIEQQEPGIKAEEYSWSRRYFWAMVILGCGWFLIYWFILPFAQWFVFDLLSFEKGEHLGGALEFFIYDTIKILMLLIALIYIIAWVRASLQVERVRNFLMGKKRGIGYFFGSLFGAITPFCSCSSIPLFLGFTTAGIPIGITLSFLITSPLINEIAIVLLWSLLGWKFTVAYVIVGMTAGMLGGFLMDKIKANRWLQPFILETMKNIPTGSTTTDSAKPQKLTIRQRHQFAYSETMTIFKRVWKWVIIGVGIGAGLHGFVPQNWFAENLGAGQWWTVPVAVLTGIPLYSNVTGIIPIMESLLLKGLPVGTTMAFCMSAVAASIPEMMMLRQIMTIRLQAAFIGYLWVILTLVGWFFNYAGPYIF